MCCVCLGRRAPRPCHPLPGLSPPPHQPLAPQQAPGRSMCVCQPEDRAKASPLPGSPPPPQPKLRCSRGAPSSPRCPRQGYTLQPKGPLAPTGHWRRSPSQHEIEEVRRPTILNSLCGWEGPARKGRPKPLPVRLGTHKNACPMPAALVAKLPPESSRPPLQTSHPHRSPCGPSCSGT
jgi:hypothetical protein